MRIDRVDTPPGLVATARSWTLLTADDGFWMVTRDAADRGSIRPRPPARGLAPAGAGARRPSAIGSSPDARELAVLVRDGRARFVPWATIRSVRVRRNSLVRQRRFPVAHVRTDRRLRLEFVGVADETVREFFAAVADRVS